ncbi:glycosylphosphatidylinositol anchor attachment 1 protein [Epargyreus clarus]|uniref:glycosylphosphatidylinositol anchor attachment 1 protein n=1 Tax=Epargyreus clarus TaxID=520877 RepID=UPI003C2C16E1
MGLLSDPEYGSLKWVRILKKLHGFISYLCYFVGLSWFFLLAWREFNNETYFSENALLPGLATNEFNAEQSAKQFHNEFLQELEDKYYNTEEMPVPWLVAKMSQLHLEVYTHNYTLNYPLGHGQVYKGTNVYGILRAPRTSSLEALVISAPYRPLSSHLKGTTAGIALMLAFAQFARPQKYWAKDIIFLITEHEQLGVQAWLEAYHGLQSEPGNFYSSLGSFYKPGMPSLDLGKLGGQWTPDQSKCLDSGKLQGRSGSIQAAINLELHTPKIKYIAVKVEGLNGQLPNLDLVNLVLKLCMKSGIHHSFKSSYSWMRNRHKMDDWSSGFWTMLEMVQAQIPGVPNGNHGLFHRFGIEAVTLEGRDVGDQAGTPPKTSALTVANFYRLGNALESIMRSMNNLLERFHQSYFFYLLAATNRFISIGQYMPSLCLMCVAMLIRALGFWVTIQKDLDDELDGQTDKTQEKTGTDSKKTQNDSKTNSDDETNESKVPGEQELKAVEKETAGDVTKGKTRTELSFSIVSIGANYLFVHLLGYGVMNSPYILSHIGATHFDVPSAWSIYHGLIFISVVAALEAPWSLHIWRTGSITREELTLVNILVLVELATACLAIGMHNFPLGLFLATVYTPLALMIRVVDDSCRRSLVMFQRVLCLLFQPLLLLSAGMIVYARGLFPGEGVGDTLERGRDAAMQGVMFSIVDSMIYGNWLFNVVTLVIFPMWLILWQIATVPVVTDQQKEQHSTKKCD